MSAVMAVTLGNTTAAGVLAIDGVLGPVRRVSVGRLEDLDDVLARACADCGGEAVPVAVASVNPPALQRFARLAAGTGVPRPEVAGADFPIPIPDTVENRGQVGVDRLLGALAAYRRTGGACVTVDFGTAITVNAVSAEGVFLGGAILPGLALMARALAQGTAALPEVAPEDTPPCIGRNTAQAVAAGLVHGAAGAVAALIRGARQTVGAKAAVILTGGGAGRLAGLLPTDCRQVQPDLVLEGLILSYRERPER